MGRKIAGVLIVGGALAFGGALHNHHTLFSSSRVFEREKAAIMAKYGPLMEWRYGRRHGTGVANENMRQASNMIQLEIDDMRSGLQKLDSEGASRKNFCLFETELSSLRAADGDVEKARLLRRNASYRENEHCEYMYVSDNNKQLGIGGVVAFVLGLAHSISLFVRRRKDMMPLDPLPSTRD